MAEDKVLNMQDEETVVSDVLNHVEAEEEYTTEYRFFAGLKLPDSNEVIKDFEIREMTGADEESLQVNSRKNMNEARSINKLLERCIVRMGNMTPQTVGVDKWREMVRSLPVPDADYALLMIRRLSFGNDIVLTSTCPECGAGIKTIVPLSELDIKTYGGDDSHTMTFTLNKGIIGKNGEAYKEGVMRLPTGVDREILLPLYKQNMGKARTLMLTRLCTFDGLKVVTEDMIRNLTLRDREILTELNKSMNDFGLDYKTEVYCEKCGSDFNVKFEDSSVSFQ